MEKTKPVAPGRKPNAELRTREHLTESEVARLQRAAGRLGRHRHRDATLIMLGYRHGLRAGELVELQWSQVDFEQGVLHVRRSKRGAPSTHPLGRTELAALRRLANGQNPSGPVFTTERLGPLTVSGIAKIVARAGKLAGLGLAVHPHMLRHSCGYYLASHGQDTRAIQAYLGHRNIQHTVRYTELAPGRFRGFWHD